MWTPVIQIKRNMGTVLSSSSATRKKKRLSSRSHPVVPPYPAVAKQVEAATTKVPLASGERKGTPTCPCVSPDDIEPHAGES